MLSCKLYYWLPDEELKKIANKIKKGEKKIMRFSFESGKIISVEFDEAAISNNQVYHLFGKIISDFEEGNEVHIQYNSSKQKGILTIR